MLVKLPYITLVFLFFSYFPFEKNQNAEELQMRSPLHLMRETALRKHFAYLVHMLCSCTYIHELAPHLIGEDPILLGPLNQLMDRALKGHPYVKSPIDIACWDIKGQKAQLPVCELMGGRYGDDFILYRAISQQTPEKMADDVSKYRSEGYRRFQLKVGGDVEIDIQRIRQAADELEIGDKLIDHRLLS